MSLGESPGGLKYSCFWSSNVSMDEFPESFTDTSLEPRLGSKERRAARIFVFVGLVREWIRAKFRLGLRGGRDPNRTMIRQEIMTSGLVCGRFEEVRTGMWLNVKTGGGHQ